MPTRRRFFEQRAGREPPITACPRAGIPSVTAEKRPGRSWMIYRPDGPRTILSRPPHSRSTGGLRPRNGLLRTDRPWGADETVDNARQITDEDWETRLPAPTRA